MVFGSSGNLDGAKAFYSDLKERTGKFGRRPNDMKIASGISVVVGETEQEARDKLESWQDLIHPDVGVMRLGMDLETDLSDLPLDESVPEHRVPASSNQHQAYFNEIAGMIRQGLTRPQFRRIAQILGFLAGQVDHPGFAAPPNRSPITWNTGWRPAPAMVS